MEIRLSQPKRSPDVATSDPDHQNRTKTQTILSPYTLQRKKGRLQSASFSERRGRKKLRITPLSPLSDLFNNVLRDTPQKANSCYGVGQIGMWKFRQDYGFMMWVGVRRLNR
jgi:hypothetical protein